MAGTFADIPDHRMKLDSDGTVALLCTGTLGSSVWVDVTAGLANAVQLDNSVTAQVSVGSVPTATLSLLFPEARTLKGMFWTGNYAGTSVISTRSVYYSTDTIDGVGGTWNNLGDVGHTTSVNSATAYPAYRTAIAAVNVSNVKGVRFQGNGQNGFITYFQCIHLYGSRSTTGIDRLAFWHPTSDIELAGSYLDWGDTPRGNITGSRQFRIKNLSATKTATTLGVTAQSVNGSVLGTPGLQVSADGTAWSSTAAPAVTTLGPGATSAIMFTRLSSDSTLVTQARSGRLVTTYGGYA